MTKRLMTHYRFNAAEENAVRRTAASIPSQAWRNDIMTMTSTYTTNHVLVISSISIVLSLHVLRFRLMSTVNYHISCLDHPGHFIDSAATPRPTRPTVNCDDQWIPIDSCCYLQNRILNGDKCEILLGDGWSWYVMVVLIADNILIISFCIHCLQFVWTCFFSWMCFQFACKHCCNCFEGLFQIAESQNVSSEGLSGFNDWSSISSENINLNGGFWSLEWFLTVLVFQNGVREISECPCFLTLWE